MATQLTRACIDDALTTLLSAVGATGAGTVTYSSKGYGSVIFNVTGSSPVGTITFQGTVDGTNWVSLEAFNVSTATFATTTTVVGVFYAPCAGFELVRANVTAFTSGTWTVGVRGNPTADTAGIAGTTTVAGTVIANQGTANATPWKVDDDATQVLLAGGLPAALAAHGGLVIEGVASGVAVPVDTELPAAAALTDSNANPTTPIIGAANLIWNATTQERWAAATAQSVRVGRAQVTPGTGMGTSFSAQATNANGTVINFGAAVHEVSMQVILTGAPSGGTVTLQCSLDNGNWWSSACVFTIGTDTSAAFKILTGTPVIYVRAVLAGLTGGTAPTVYAYIAGY